MRVNCLFLNIPHTHIAVNSFIEVTTVLEHMPKVTQLLGEQFCQDLMNIESLIPLFVYNNSAN